MADDLPVSIACGGGATGYAEILTPPSATYGWTHSSGYGRAVDLCKEDLDRLDDVYKSKLSQRLDKWVEQVSCAASEHCAHCHKASPNHVGRSDVQHDDIIHKSGNINQGLVAVERLYWASTGFVDCVCPHQVIIHSDEDHHAIGKTRDEARRRFIHEREKSGLIGAFSE